MSDKGTCEKHGKFVLNDGCAQCLADQQGLEGNTQASLEEAIKVAREASAAVHIAEPEIAVALRPGEDIEARGHYKEAKRLLEYANKRVIDSIEDKLEATNDLSLISTLKKAMTAKKSECLEPHTAKVDAIRATYDYLMFPILEAEKVTKDKMLAFNAEQKHIRAEQEKVNALRLEAAQKDAALHNGELSEPVNLVEVMPEVPKKTITEMGSAATFKVRKWEIESFGLVPDDLKLIDAGKVTKLVKAGISSIAGIRIWEEDSLRITPRNS